MIRIRMGPVFDLIRIRRGGVFYPHPVLRTGPGGAPVDTSRARPLASPIKSIWQEKQTIITPILPPSGTVLYCGTAIGGHAPEPLSFFGFLFSEHRTRGFGVLRTSSRFFVYKGRKSSAPINRGWGEPRKLAPNHAKTANFRGKARSSKKNRF